MNQITDPANDNYGFGLDFNYAQWSANSVLTLTNVPWNNDYRDVVQFDTTNDLNTYINASETVNVTITNASYAKANEPVNIATPFNVASRFNYLRVYNPAQPLHTPDESAYLYYFISDVRYVAPNTTQIVVQLDVWQTYIRRVQFGRCYIERGHIGIANEHNFRNYGRDFLSIPEGLDTGAEYNVLRKLETSIMTPSSAHPASDPLSGAGSSILVCSTIDLTIDGGSVRSPVIRAARGSSFQSIPSGASYYIFETHTEFFNFLQSRVNKPWILQGIISVTLIPFWRRYMTPIGSVTKNSIGAYETKFGINRRNVIRGALTGWRTHPSVTNYLPPRYRHLRKFWTYPYMALRVSNFAGQNLILRPEMWNDPDATMVESASLVPPNQRVYVYPRDYNAISKDTNPNFDNGDGSDHGITITGFPSVAIVNDNATLYMANNAHSLSFGRQSADWSQSKALRSNEVGYDQATRSTGAGNQLADISSSADAQSVAIGNQLMQDQWALNAITGIAGGAGSGMVAGPLGAGIGAAQGIASAAGGLFANQQQIGSNNAQLANRQSAAAASRSVGAGVENYMRDTNKGLADWAARGDYASAIAGISARVQDAQLTPPGLVGMQGGDVAGLVAFGALKYRIDVLMPSQGVIQTIGDYWLRYGYAVQRFSHVPNNLKVMERFTYWKLSETYIRAAGMPEAFKQTIRGILEKGVTVWSNPDDIGVIALHDNMPLQGITLDDYTPPPFTPDPEPEPPAPPVRRKRKHTMITFSTIDDNPATPGPVWALAGTSPGTSANWVETRDAVRGEAFVAACGVDAPVGVTPAEFYVLKDTYLEPLATLASDEGGTEPEA